jgi:hypothetical protein
MKIKPTNQMVLLELQQELSDMFEPEKTAHFFRHVAGDSEYEKTQNEGDCDINELSSIPRWVAV